MVFDSSFATQTLTPRSNFLIIVSEMRCSWFIILGFFSSSCCATAAEAAIFVGIGQLIAILCCAYVHFKIANFFFFVSQRLWKLHSINSTVDFYLAPFLRMEKLSRPQSELWYVFTWAQFLLADSLWKWKGSSDWLLSVIAQIRSAFLLNEDFFPGCLIMNKKTVLDELSDARTSKVFNYL